MASEEWDKAYDRYMQDRSQSLGEFSTNANLGNQVYQNLMNKNTALLGQAQNAQDNVSNAYVNYLQNLANQNLINISFIDKKIQHTDNRQNRRQECPSQ